MSGKLAAVGFLTGFLLLTFAGILAYTSDSTTAAANQVDGRRLQNQPQTGLSGSPSSSSSSGSLFEHAGNNWYTIAPLGAVGGEYIAYIVFGVISMFYAWFYKQHVVDQVLEKKGPMQWQEDTGKDDFDVDLCACWADICMCMHMILPCMVWVRQAHTNEVTGGCGYWSTFAAYIVTGLCCCIGPCCLTVYFRMQLKDHMGLEDHLLNDLCLAWLCLPCTVAQQALAVDRKLGYTVDGCCTLDWDDEESLHRLKNPYEDDR